MRCTDEANTEWAIRMLDVRGLEPPEPMIRVLEALDELPFDERLRMLIDREPRPLYPLLANNGYVFNTVARPTGQYEVTIWRLQVRDAGNIGP